MMTAPTPAPLPDFERPPIQEVALSVQFGPLFSLRTPQLGQVWEVFRDRFPVTQEHAPLPAVIEEFGRRQPFRVGIEVIALDAPPLPRLWLLNASGTELIQVQQDRFIHNWRKVEATDEYPRYQRLRNTFRNELEQFDELLRRKDIGEFVPNQCEVTYVNQLVASKEWERHGQLDRVLTMWSSTYSDGFLGEPEAVQMAIHYVIPGPDGEPIGRLHVNVEPGYEGPDGKPILIVRLTARGRPLGDGIEGVLRFLDVGHDWAVRGFASITSSRMHRLWKRSDGGERH
jgi:uncharacterized protein (TIGR04255 family)